MGDRFSRIATASQLSRNIRNVGARRRVQRNVMNAGGSGGGSASRGH